MGTSCSKTYRRMLELFKLNDVHPNRDFALLKNFTQMNPGLFHSRIYEAYLMHNTLAAKISSCLTLTGKF